MEARSDVPGPALELALARSAVAAAAEAGLRYVHGGGAGIRRIRCGAGFRYVTSSGSAISLVERQRITSLAIPPAWTEVWICPLANGHVQATGRDARRRKQYRYHPRWREVRDQAKFGRMLAFAAKLPRIRARCERDLRRAGLPREKILAIVVRLLEETLIRVGNEEYSRANGSYGLTTLRNHHVDVHGDRIRFRFRGKGGRVHTVEAHDRRAARIVKQCQELPGHVLFEYLGPDGKAHPIESSHVNAYLHEAAGEEFTAKDFRTWFGSLVAARVLRERGGRRPTKRAVTQALVATAKRLGNTPAICRKCYVHPEVIRCYLDGRLVPLRPEESEEQALVKLLSPPPTVGRARTRRAARSARARSERLRVAWPSPGAPAPPPR
jgi:DNA topoisomerase-1